MSDQVQCPNCGGYRVYQQVASSHLETHTRRSNLGARVFAGVLTFYSVGLFLLDKGTRDALVKGEEQETTKVADSYQNSCLLCGYLWVWTVGDPLPQVQVRPDLIAVGEQRLREEAERLRQRQQDAADLWYLTHHQDRDE
jgi:hypothetical protein